ncbi:Gfo/Idh/MocA family oxidoreductase [Geobacter pelophilus]|uniref:Gfo/Idh/MocA family oxidoreductase n=1 Tax=Geoanaerobacter pelophilus TaxID=60036 RepID=A0AAW4L6Y1_9BACT|nr:Gfo/Idh/MocA family oxidoreductase [Geoanaerobacter pelophilus]MBT0665307.1 Gfo/Idh/MocA family oxidoreductase [Geoanaerobacter pelophilus]
MKSSDPRCRLLQVGILGYSDIARRKFIPAVLSSKSFHLAAIGVRDTLQSAACSLKPGCPVLGYDELLACPAVDLIYISLPNHLHEEWTIRALEQGKHVICEKPLGLTPESVERILRCAAANTRLLYENLMFLQHPQHAIAKELVASGKIGRLTSLRSVFGFPEPGNGNFRLDAAMGGGALNDLSRYPIGTALYFLNGELDQFSGIALNRNRLNRAVHGTAISAAQEIFTFSMVFGQQYESFYELIGETGKIRVDRAYTTPTDMGNSVKLTQGSEETIYLAPAADHFLLSLDLACSLIRNGADFQEIHDRARKVAVISEQIKKGCRDVEV